TLLSSWEKQMVEPFVVNGVVTPEHNNQSLPGLAYRLTTRSPSFSKFDFDLWKYTPVEYCNLLTLDPLGVQWLLKGCLVAFALMVIWSCRTPPVRRASWRLAAEFGVVLLGMLLFSERTWKHHCVTLVLPFAVLVYYLATCQPGRKLRLYLIGTLAVSALLIVLAGLDTQEEGFGEMMQVYGAYTWTNLLLTAALATILRLDARSTAGDTSEPKRPGGWQALNLRKTCDSVPG